MNSTSNFHKSFRLPIFIAQIFGFFPIDGISNDYKSLHFKWLTFKTIYAYFSAFGFIITLCFCLNKICKTGYKSVEQISKLNN